MSDPGKRPLASCARPKQARSERTLARLLDAAEALIRARGVSEVSVADVVRKARSSVGGFYARFKDKDELLRALHERQLASVERRIDELAAFATREDVPLRAVVRVALAALVEDFRLRRPLVAAFVAHAAHAPKAWARSIEHRRRVIARVSDVVYARRAEMRPGITLRDVEFAVQLAFSLADTQALHGGLPLRGGRLEDDEMGERLEALFAAYLGLDAVRT